MLENKVAVVTGGSRGIGKAIALKLASEGANIVVNYTSNSTAADEVVKEVEALGVKGIAVKANVSVASDIENLIKETESQLGKIDILVNNAGITRDGLLIRMKEEDFDQVIDVNLKGVFLATKLIGKKMLKQRAGAIVNITSVVGLMGNAGQANYAASKAGVIGFTKSVAREFASRGIRVNAVAPGFIESDMTAKLDEKVVENYMTAIPLARFGSAADVANTVSFLVGDQSAYITGQTLQVDGGMYI
ncbi:3-oxoacyl-[acyl-carrier-protein] reductase [Acidaminobacter sp. JC074]|uniref:3-oxoacyl-[acyl-carrier-protein] reductase n=1 Tax=Acidaminobacter sp. JC074 TaxID=2530199 RepID=UPI001F10CE92|nr:3-oxoacyl-[acyl-carrier-protein] reductase [Acidaminobacter sp. JC074]MCH4888342.1 3-oxoacyl-[acyl-carrier-protein] reductase [Acidaminobacter sp. JC074]